MEFEKKVISSFKKAKQDIEGIKNEIAFLAKRIAKLEDTLTNQVIHKLAEKQKKKR